MPVPKFNPLPAVAPVSAPMPGLTGAAVVPSDSVNFTTPTRRLWIGAAGAVSVAMGGTTVVFAGVPVGWLDVACTRVNATGTVATSILAFAG